jgi:hypothetical protein
MSVAERIKLAFLIASAMTCTSVRAQGTFLYDQQSSTNEALPAQQIGVIIQSLSPFGQSFTPSFASVGFIRVRLLDNTPSNGLGATVHVNLRSDSITGTILGSTAPVDVPDGSLGSVSFLFPEPIAVIPGTKYYFDLAISGDLWKADATEYNYAGGEAVMLGLGRAASDLWFREGVIVPEPSPAILLTTSFAVLAYFRRSKTLAHRGRAF